MNYPNMWALILGLTLFLLGIDSAFSMVEATATVIQDTKYGSYIPRMFTAFSLTIPGFLFSLPFCTNWGFILFDCVDHYLCNYLLIIIGILECLGVAWGFEASRTMKRSHGHSRSIIYLTVSYWLIIFTVGLLDFPIGKAYVAGILILVVAIVPSWFISGLRFHDYYRQIFFCGVRKIAYSMTMLGRTNKSLKRWYEPFFVLWWGLSIKYIIPASLWFILVEDLKLDLSTPYGGHPFIF